MKTRDIVEQTQHLLADGQTQAAIDFLRPFLEAEKSRSQQLARALRLTESNLRQAQQKAFQNLLTADETRKEEAQATASILSILEHLEDGKTAKTPAQKMQRGLWLLIVLAGAAAVALFVIWPLFRPDCPVFEDKTALKIIILPFTNVGEKAAKPEKILQTDIEMLTQKVGIRADAELHKNYDAAENQPDFTKAKRLAKNCGGDLVIWGEFLETGDSTRMRLFFQFAEGEARSTGFVAMPDPTFWQKGELKTTMQDALFSVCAAIAVRDQKLDVAEKWLEKVAQKSDFETNGLAQLAVKKAATH